ncbi:unnamed protein product [Linum tenue]|uniref:Uncharacterized protein n=1 Tax=Linum tenue TaxID=586396 RepID=A0AAV0JYK6_9ROSI|nr:unnamed protein product [Linum tenue]
MSNSGRNRLEGYLGEHG